MLNIQIKEPCPVALSRMTKKGKGFNCKSCQENVVDFRDKSKSEIIELMKTSSCGIFYKDDLLPSPKQSFNKKIIFYSLSILSIVGFNINPVQAQKPDYVKEEVCPIENPSEKVETDKRQVEISHKRIKRPFRFRLFRKKRKGRMIRGYF